MSLLSSPDRFRLSVRGILYSLLISLLMQAAMATSGNDDYSPYTQAHNDDHTNDKVQSGVSRPVELPTAPRTMRAATLRLLKATTKNGWPALGSKVPAAPIRPNAGNISRAADAESSSEERKVPEMNDAYRILLWNLDRNIYQTYVDLDQEPDKLINLKPCYFGSGVRNKYRTQCFIIAHLTKNIIIKEYPHASDRCDVVGIDGHYVARVQLKSGNYVLVDNQRPFWNREISRLGIPGKLGWPPSKEALSLEKYQEYQTGFDKHGHFYCENGHLGKEKRSGFLSNQEKIRGFKTHHLKSCWTATYEILYNHLQTLM